MALPISEISQYSTCAILSLAQVFQCLRLGIMVCARTQKDTIMGDESAIYLLTAGRWTTGLLLITVTERRARVSATYRFRQSTMMSALPITT